MKSWNRNRSFLFQFLTCYRVVCSLFIASCWNNFDRFDRFVLKSEAVTSASVLILRCQRRLSLMTSCWTSRRRTTTSGFSKRALGSEYKYAWINFLGDIHTNLLHKAQSECSKSKDFKIVILLSIWHLYKQPYPPFCFPPFLPYSLFPPSILRPLLSTGSHPRGSFRHFSVVFLYTTAHFRTTAHRGCLGDV